MKSRKQNSYKQKTGSQLLPPEAPAALRLSARRILFLSEKLPFVRVRKTSVTGDKIIGQDRDQPLAGRRDDPAADHSGRVAAKAHTHGQRLLAAGPAAVEGVIHIEGDPR